MAREVHYNAWQITFLQRAQPIRTFVPRSHEATDCAGWCGTYAGASSIVCHCGHSMAGGRCCCVCLVRRWDLTATFILDRRCGLHGT